MALFPAGMWTSLLKKRFGEQAVRDATKGAIETIRETPNGAKVGTISRSFFGKLLARERAAKKAAADKEMHEQTQPLNKLHQNPADEISLAEQTGRRQEGGGDGQILADTEEGLITGERRLMKRSQLGR